MLPSSSSPSSISNTPQTQAGGAALLQAIGMVREMKVYPLVESDMRHLTLLNTASTAFLSIGLTVFLFGLGLYFNMKLAEQISTETIKLMKFVIPVFYVVAATFGLLGWLFWSQRGSELKRILSESKLNQ